MPASNGYVPAPVIPPVEDFWRTGVSPGSKPDGTNDVTETAWRTGNVGVATALPQATMQIGAGTDAPSAASPLLYVAGVGDAVASLRNSASDVELALLASTGLAAIGTMGADILRLRTNNQDRVSVSPTGAVVVESGGATPVPSGHTGGLELFYDSDANNAGVSGGTGAAFLQAYNRTGAAWKDLNLRGANTGFWANGALVATMLANGNFGIGVNPPLTPLHVAGAATFGSTIQVRGVANVLVPASGEGLELWYDADADYNFSSGGTGAGVVTAYDRTGLVLHDLQIRGNNIGFHAGAFLAATLLANGNFGIGASVPTTKLEVNGSVTLGSVTQVRGTTAAPVDPIAGKGMELSYDTDASFSAASVGAGAGILQSYDRDGGIRRDTQIHGQNIGFWVNGAFAGTFISGGNFGVGLSNPATPLHVGGSGTFNDTLQVRGGAAPASATGDGLEFQYDTDLGYSGGAGAGSGVIQAINHAGTVWRDLQIKAANIGFWANGTLITTVLANGVMAYNNSVQVRGSASPAVPSGEGLDFLYDTDATYDAVSGGAGAGIVQAYDATGFTWRDMQIKGNNIGFWANGALAATVLANGNFGIGVNPPITPFHVGVPTTFGSTIQIRGMAAPPTPTSGAGVEIWYDTDAAYGASSGGTGAAVFTVYDRTGAALHDMQLRAANIGFHAGGILAATLLANGNFGIGVVPTSKLDVKGNVNLGDPAGASTLGIDGATATNRDILFYTAGLSRWLLRCNATAEGGANAGSDFQILARTDAGGGLTTAMHITRSSGFVGLGIAPSYRLDVNGASRFAATMYINATPFIGADDGAGTAGTLGLTNAANAAANGAGAGSVKMKGATARDSVGFIKMYQGVTPVWIPYWTTITG